MHRRTFLRAGVGAGIVTGARVVPAATLLLAGCAPGGGTSSGPASFSGVTMGTGFRVQLATALEDSARAELEALVHATLSAVDQAMSTYKPDSELARLNASSQRNWVPLSSATYHVIAKALNVWQLSGGAFDISVAPLVDLWGFGPRGPRNTVPAEAALARAHAEVGLGRIELSPETRAVRKTHALTRLDLSGIAKGYALDRVAEQLNNSGFDAYLIDVGGEL
ncbi:MAG: FAD:protein FMN transferase, partial [Chromatiales bacterium]|nr:FAD:protein FMN transferase [Chromatiales bacterium]